MAEILIAEDDKNVREGLEDLFAGSGYSVRSAADGEEAIAEYVRKRPDLVILDVMMPKCDGYAVLSDIRRRDPLLPVIMLTACGEQIDKVNGLGSGADDYMTKPFDVTELLARVARALKRIAAVKAREAALDAAGSGGGADADAAARGVSGGGENAPFAFGGAMVDPLHMCLMDGRRAKVPLSSREIGILRLMARHPGEALGRDHMLGTLWGIDYFYNTRTLDQHIAQLRKKLGRNAACLETVIGVGYRYEPDRAKAGGRK